MLLIWQGLCQQLILEISAAFLQFLDTQAIYALENVNHSVRILLAESPFGVISLSNTETDQQ